MLAHAVDASESSQPRQGVRGLVIATFAFVTVFAASAVPIPLYSEYKGAIGLTDADISATMLMYLFGVVLTLFLSGSLSDAAGRRPLAAASLLLAMLGCFLFLRAADPTIVLVARAVQGVSCGLAMSAVSALVVDSAVGRYEGFGLAVAGCGALLGVMAGSLAVGFLSLVTQQHALIYWIMIALLALGAILIPAAPETVVSRVPLRTACKPVIGVDAKLRGVLPIAACAYVASWGVARSSNRSARRWRRNASVRATRSWHRLSSRCRWRPARWGRRLRRACRRACRCVFRWRRSSCSRARCA